MAPKRKVSVKIVDLTSDNEDNVTPSTKNNPPPAKRARGQSSGRCTPDRAIIPPPVHSIEPRSTDSKTTTDLSFDGDVEFSPQSFASSRPTTVSPSPREDADVCPESVFQHATTPQRSNSPPTDIAGLPLAENNVAEATPLTADAPIAPLATTEANPLNPVYKLPELANRYIPRIDKLAGIEYRNPLKFCLKPPFWQPWSSKTYIEFARCLRLTFDPEPFAQANHKTVEEVRHVFDAVVVNPLYDAKEAARRGKEGMKTFFEAVNQFGTPMRVWGEKGKVRGGLYRARKGGVDVVDWKGARREVE